MSSAIAYLMSLTAPLHADPDGTFPPNGDLPIALRKGTRFSTTKHPLSNNVSFDYLGLVFCSFAIPISSTIIPTSYPEACQSPP